MPASDPLSNSGSPADHHMPLEELVPQVGAAILAGFVVAAIFRATIVSRDRDRSSSLPTTLILLTLMTAILTLVIGGNVARAFGLVGALSIVRFRTVVEDTRDTAFVIFAVVVGMAVGANYAVLAAVGIVAVAVVSGIMRWVVPRRMLSTAKLHLSLRLDLEQDIAPVLAVIDKYAGEVKAIGTSTAKKGAAMDLQYSVRLTGEPESMIPFVAALNGLNGVQSVELKENFKI